MHYPLVSGWYKRKDSEISVYVLGEEDGLVHIESAIGRSAILSESFVKNYEWCEFKNTVNK